MSAEGVEPGDVEALQAYALECHAKLERLADGHLDAETLELFRVSDWMKGYTRYTEAELHPDPRKPQG